MKQTGRICGCIQHLAGRVRRPHVNIVVIVLLVALALPLIGTPGTMGIGLLVQTLDLMLRARESFGERPALATTTVSA